MFNINVVAYYLISFVPFGWNVLCYLRVLRLGRDVCSLPDVHIPKTNLYTCKVFVFCVH